MKMAKRAVKPEDLVTYCGAYCGTCARWRDYTAFRDCARALAEIADGHGFHRWMPRAVKEFNYAEFRKGLEFFSRDDTWLVCQQPCKFNDAMAACRFRVCCERRGISLCFECSEFPCAHNKPNRPMLERAKEYRRLGKEEWLRQLVEKARQGFEHHTKKRYEISAAGFLPSRRAPHRRQGKAPAAE
jgi:hypothetical protein